jgi:hypothetical protein
MVKSIDLPFSLKAPGGPFFTSPQFHLFRPIRAHLIWPVTTSVQPVATYGTGALVFQTQSGGGIYVISADGVGLRYLTHGIDPQLSPDGSQLMNYSPLTLTAAASRASPRVGGR